MQLWENEFDLGIRKNWTNAFELSGPWWFCILLLPSTTPLKGDGVHFPSRNDGYEGSNIVFKNQYPELSPTVAVQMRQPAHAHTSPANSPLSSASTGNEGVVTATGAERGYSRERSAFENDRATLGPDLV